MKKSNNQVNWSWIRKKDNFVNKEKSSLFRSKKDLVYIKFLFLQKKNIHIIPPLWENGIFVSECAEKTEIFNNFFASQ